MYFFLNFRNFLLLLNGPNCRIHFLKCGLQSNCRQNWARPFPPLKIVFGEREIFDFTSENYKLLLSAAKGQKIHSLGVGYWILSYVSTIKYIVVKFIYSEKATNFCDISTADLSCLVTLKSTVEISQKFVAFSKCMNFT